MVSPRSASGQRRRAAAARPYHHGNLRQALLDAADELVSRHGSEKLTLRDVATEAGVSHTAPYHHFAGLADLLAAVAARGFSELAEAMMAVPRDSLPERRLQAICDLYVCFARRQPARFRLMFGPVLARKGEHPDLRAAADRAFAALLEAATAQDAANAPLLALTGWCLAHGLANLAIDGVLADLPVPVPAPDDLARDMTRLVLERRSRPAGSRRR